MSDVFVSYKAEDRRRIRPLVEALQADGLSVWWDEHIGAGDAWRETIQKQLDGARSVLVVWSKRSVGPEGQFVREEASRSQRRGAYVPVLIDAVEPPLGFGENQAMWLCNWRGDRADPHYKSVLSALCRHSGREKRTAIQPGFSPVNRRGVIVGGAAAAVSVAGVAGWALLRPSSASASNSIAVLPFANLSGDPTQAYFSDGLAEELRSALSRIAQLKVVARTSSEAVRNDDAKSAATKLGVANILSGSVRRSSQVIRISAQLIDGRTGFERWSEDFDQPVGDTLAIQSVIASKVSGALRLQLTGAAKRMLNVGGTEIVAAQDLFLKAKVSTDRDTPKALRESLGNVDAAIQLDSKYGAAYALKSELLSYFSAQNARTSAEVGTLLTQAVSNAKRAVALAPNLAQGHAALAFAYNFQLKFRDALREVQVAVRLPGADADVQARYAMLLAESDHGEAAENAAAKAISLDPLNPESYQTQALVLFVGRKFGSAVVAARRSLELDPAGVFVRGILANSLVMMGRNEEAALEYSKMPADSWQALAGRAIIAARKHDIATSDRLAQQLRAAWGDSANSQMVEIYAQRGDGDKAIAYLKEPVAQRDPGFVLMLVDPFLDPIRSDPRFIEVIQSMNFPTT